METGASCRLEPVLGYTPAPLPPDETARLEELHRMEILDTPAEERFDRIVKLAARIFDVPISYVALLDGERQWFKSRLGMEPPQTPRESSFCGHAILQDDPLIVHDARRDMRFAGNPLVIGPPFVRFYAGQPVRGPRGYKVGTLCILDPRVRTLKPEEVALLRDLGLLVEHELAMRDAIAWQKEAVRAREALEAKQQELARTVEKFQTEKLRSDELFRTILPEAMIEELKASGTVAPVFHPEVGVMFADFSGFTLHASTIPPAAVVEQLNDCFCHFDWVAAKHGVEKLKTIGDGYLAVSGMPEARPDDALRLLRAALEIRDYIAERREAAAAQGQSFWNVRIGLHLGPLVAGIVGVRKISYDVWGDTVNTASRLESAGQPGRVNVSRSFYERVRSWVDAESRGALPCKGKGEVEMFFINSLREPPAAPPTAGAPNGERKSVRLDPYSREMSQARI